MRNMDDLVKRMAMYPEIIAATETVDGNRSGVTVPWLASLLKNSPMPAVYGLYMARDAKSWQSPDSDPWVDRKSWPRAARLKYDFHDPSQDWYRGAQENKGLHVTQPYFDEGGSDIEMISITRPVYSATGSFLGVAGADVALDEMRKIVRKMNVRSYETIADLDGKGGRVTSITKMPEKSSKALGETAYLLSKTGAIIVAPEEEAETAAPKPEEHDPAKALENLLNKGLVTDLPGIREILATPSGWLRLRDDSDKVIYWAEGKTTEWKLVLEVPYSFIVGPARTLAIQSAVIGGVGLFLLLGVILFVARRVSGPIAELQTVAADFEKGSYGRGKGVLQRIEKRPDELGRFARSFSAMAGEIKLREERLSEWNINLERTVHERTAELAEAINKVEATNKVMAAELTEAAAYSRAVLPARLNGSVGTDWVFVTSSQLGGDSFGYHWLDKENLAIYLLDVCGHGVGAALLSISVVNLLRTGSLSETNFHSPSAVLSNLNTAFPMEQHNDMYFTAWYGVYSLPERRLRYACGGHPPAVLVGPDGRTSLLAAKGSIVGAFPGVSYETASTTIESGSRLYLFSDGTYEIDRPDGTMMTHEEFSRILSDAGDGSNLESVVAEVRRQQGSDDFADDFSLVEFRFPGNASRTEGRHGVLALRAELPELARLHPFLKAYCEREGTPTEQVFDFEIILEELVTNVIKYGGVRSGDECCLIELLREGNHLTIRFSDNGIPFNPLERDDVDISKPIEEREIGGLGIHFIKKLTDTQNYERRDGRNVLTLTKELRS